MVLRTPVPLFTFWVTKMESLRLITYYSSLEIVNNYPPLLLPCCVVFQAVQSLVSGAASGPLLGLYLLGALFPCANRYVSPPSHQSVQKEVC